MFIITGAEEVIGKTYAMLYSSIYITRIYVNTGAFANYDTTWVLLYVYYDTGNFYAIYIYICYGGGWEHGARNHIYIYIGYIGLGDTILVRTIIAGQPQRTSAKHQRQARPW